MSHFKAIISIDKIELRPALDNVMAICTSQGSHVFIVEELPTEELIKLAASIVNAYDAVFNEILARTSLSDESINDLVRAKNKREPRKNTSTKINRPLRTII